MSPEWDCPEQPDRNGRLVRGRLHTRDGEPWALSGEDGTSVFVEAHRMRMVRHPDRPRWMNHFTSHLTTPYRLNNNPDPIQTAAIIEEVITRLWSMPAAVSYQCILSPTGKPCSINYLFFDSGPQLPWGEHFVDGVVQLRTSARPKIHAAHLDRCNKIRLLFTITKRSVTRLRVVQGAEITTETQTHVLTAGDHFEPRAHCEWLHPARFQRICDL